jgi:signal transduction histidine kinase
MTPPNLSPDRPTDEAGAVRAHKPGAPEAHALVARALAASPEPCAAARADGALVFVNPAMLLAAKLDPEGPRPASLSDLAERFRAGGFDDPASAIAEVLRTGQAFERDVTDFGSGLTFALRIWPVTFEGATAGVAFTVRDVSRRHDAERLRDALASLVSHELRTPLTSIGGFADLLAEDDTLPAEAREFLAIIREETRRLARMVGILFAGARPEEEEAAGHEPVSLDHLAREAVSHFRPAAAARGVALTLHDGPRVPPVAAVHRRVAGAVASLLDEALEQAEPGTTITVSTSLEASTVSLCVEWRPISSSGSGRQAGDDQAGEDKEALLREAVGTHGGRLVRESGPESERARLIFPRL